MGKKRSRSVFVKARHNPLLLGEADEQRPETEIEGIRREIDKGRRSGRAKPAAEVLDRLEKKYMKMAKDRTSIT